MVNPAGHGKKSFENRQYQIMGSSSEDGRDIICKYKAAAHSLLGLSVLVQNRRKEKDAILVFASRAQVVSYPSTVSAVMNGTAEGDNIVKVTRDRCVLSITLTVQRAYSLFLWLNSVSSMPLQVWRSIHGTKPPDLRSPTSTGKRSVFTLRSQI